MSRLRRYCTVRRVCTVLVTICCLPAYRYMPMITLAAILACAVVLITPEESD